MCYRKFLIYFEYGTKDGSRCSHSASHYLPDIVLQTEIRHTDPDSSSYEHLVCLPHDWNDSLYHWYTFFQDPYTVLIYFCALNSF